MARLEDFSTQSSLSLDDFQVEGPLVFVNNRPSDTNLAAYTAALSGDPESIEANYLQASGSFAQGDMQPLEDVRNRARQLTREASQPALVSILTDPSVSDEEKMAAANAYADDQSSLYGIEDVVATEALAEPIEDETEESADARINLAGIVHEVNEANRQRQILLNEALAQKDPTTVELAAGFAELLIPFAEQGIVSNIRAQMGEAGVGEQLAPFALLGEGKESIREILQRVPPSQRADIDRKLVEVINNSSTLTFPTENDFVRQDLLRTFLEDGYYGDGSAWLDNVVSLVELTGLGAILGEPLSAATSARRLSRASEIAPSSRLSDEALRASEDAVETRNAERIAERQEIGRQNSGGSTAPDEELRAAEDAQEARRAAPRQDPVRRAEDAQERRTEARRALLSDDDSLRALENEAAQKAYVRSQVKPVSLSQSYRNTNPAKARASHEAAASDTTDRVAEALYGTNRTEAIANDHLPEVGLTNRSVQNKVSMPDVQPVKPLPPNPRVMDTASSNGAIYLSPAEKTATATRVVNDFNNASGLVARTEMTVPEVREIGQSMRIGVTYGPRDNGWSSAADAVEKVKTSLRSYGVKDSDLTVLERRGDRYVPATGPTPEGGDYLVKVDYPYTFSAGEVEDWDDLDVTWNFLDRIPHMTNARQGSVQRHFLDPHSMLHPTITKAANKAVDATSQLEKELLDLTKVFSEKFNALPKVSQQAVERELKRANKKGSNRSTVSLRAHGFGDKEIGAIKSWREVWDTIYWLENQDLVKTLRNRRYGVLEDSISDTRLFAREMPRTRAGSFQRAYDPATGEMVNLVAEDLTDLYNKGGSVAQLRSPLLVKEEAADLVIARNQPGGPYLRNLRDNDQILNYREGYYTVYYDAPKLIVKTITDSQGNKLKEGAIATAGDIQSANRALKRYEQEAQDGVTYHIRDARERIRNDSEDNWSLQEAAGRTAQRVRGERLEDATSPITDEAHNHVLGPVDSLVRSVRNVSARVPMRDYLEAAKARAINQYGHMFPKDRFGRPEFPSHSKDIKADQAFSKEAADARTTVEYINSLEFGYINAIDDSIKFALRAIADAAGNAKFSMAERALNALADFGGPTRIARGTAFTLYLALNPVRQFFVQGHQAVQLLALAPRYAATRLAGDMAAMIEMKAFGKPLATSKAVTNRTDAEIREMFDAMDRSGLLASIDKQNLVRGSLSDIADATAAGAYRRTPVARAAGLAAKGIATSRKAGFDVGEAVNMMSSWLTHYDMAKKAAGGKKLTASELDDVAAQARSYTYNMNRAGEMPYNENFMGMVFQFMQVPHKAFLQMTTNRTLTRAQKARLATFNLVMYGGPPGTLLTTYMAPWLPEDGEIREAILQGIEGYSFNKLASLMYGEDVGIDFSSLSATDQSGLLEFVSNLWTTDVGKMLSESPAGSLVAGSNPRITNFARTAAQYFHFTEPTDGSVASASETVSSFLGMASGFSSAFRAKVALEYGKKYSSSGGVTDSEVNTPEAIAAIAGFATLDEARGYWLSNEMYERRKSHDDDVKEWYRLVKQELAREGITNDEREYALRVLNVAAEQFTDDPRAYNTIQQQLQYDVENGDLSMFESVIRASEWMDPQHTRELINNAPMTDEQKETGRSLLDYIDNYREED